MPPEEFDAWRAYDTYVEPLGDQRLARQLALLACLYANAHRPKHRALWDLDDFDLFRPRAPHGTRAEEEERFRAAWYEAGLVTKAA